MKHQQLQMTLSLNQVFSESTNVTVVQGDNKYPLLNECNTFYVCKGNTCLPPSNILSEEL
ncbi:hypothetical protein [Ruminococcus sp.]|uniref:hypothetical protein n=1 Tax=Ruminococcus sp. TaxID=41978 RepID=UPI0026010247|nr:hypothetical protein [Ruminococcus sp.]